MASVEQLTGGRFEDRDLEKEMRSSYLDYAMSVIVGRALPDIHDDTVDFGPNYDNSEQEPLILPARFPNLLVNGSAGIAVGMATNVPPHNLREAIAATVAYIDDPDVAAAGLMKHVKGPDFPTGGIIVGRQGIKDAYETGRRSEEHT